MNPLIIHLSQASSHFLSLALRMTVEVEVDKVAEVGAAFQWWLVLSLNLML
jgi:hypothetical protein